MYKVVKYLLGAAALVILALQFSQGDQFRRDFIAGFLIILILVAVITVLQKRSVKASKSS